VATRLAIISDVHVDVHALRDALAHIERLGCDRVVCAGDVVGYGLFAQEVITLLRERCIPCVRGNHDRWAVGRGSAHDPDADSGDAPHDASGWDLSADAVDFLASLPARWGATIEGVKVVVCHGTPQSDMTGVWPDQATAANLRARLDESGADVLVVGHTHVPFALDVAERGRVVNPGALLSAPARPMDAAWLLDPATGTFRPSSAAGGGTFGVLELPSMEFHVHRAVDGAAVRPP
jgi:putative phosphoesterase